MILFYAPWCEPCRRVLEFIEDMPAPVELVDVDRYPARAEESCVRAVPTLHILQGDVLVHCHVGTKTIHRDRVLCDLEEMRREF